MSGLPNTENLELIKYLLAGWVFLGGAVNALIVYIFKNTKKKVEDLEKAQKLDHDKIIRIESQHENNHNGNSHDSH